MDYIAVIDYEHLDNGMFLNAFAHSLARQKESRGLIIHGESAYTERLIQTGVMREDAVIRAIKDLNHRLIALLADNGAATIGLNGYQRSLVTVKEESIDIDTAHLRRLPATPHLLISALAHTPGHKRPTPVGLPILASALARALDIGEVILFRMDDSDPAVNREASASRNRKDRENDTPEPAIPIEFREIPFSFRLTSTHSFAAYPSLKGTTLYRPES